MKLQKVAIVSKVGSKDSEKAARDVAKKILTKKSKVYTISPIEIEGATKIETLEELKKEKLDLVITLGGDGTTLRVFRYLDNETPILTINVGGNRGILAEITIDEIDDAINQILKDNFFLDKRVRVVASCGGKEFPPALNEIYISRANLTKTAEIEIKFQNDTVKQKMDGVIIATPSGSTGHSFSLGGPILHESLDVLIITPVAPVYRLESIVVPDEKIEIICSHDCNIVMDAQVIKTAEYEESIIIKKYKKPAIFVRLKKRGLRQMSKALDFKILDASAFYAGIPFKTSKDCHTTSLVYEEIKHIKKNHDALGILLQTNRLKIREPDKKSTEAAIKYAKETGDYPQLSKQDISIIALCIDVKGEMISDDFAILNVIKNIGLKISPVMSIGIKDIGKWIHYCPGCRINYKNEKECSSCGTPLKRKLLKEKQSSNSFNK